MSKKVMVKLARIWNSYCKYRRFYPGFSGIIRILRLVYFIIWKSGFRGLLVKIRTLDQLQDPMVMQAAHEKHLVHTLKEEKILAEAKAISVAIHIHAFYIDIAKQIMNYLQNMPVGYSLFVTTDTPEKEQELRKLFATLSGAKTQTFHISENRGRDIFPMLVGLGEDLAKFELVLHLHTKRSPHDEVLLCGWRRYLLECVLGSPGRIAAVINKFHKDADLGILFPYYYHPMRKFVFRSDFLNDQNIRLLIQRFSLSRDEITKLDRSFFPAGDFFWFRGDAIRPFLKMDLSSKDFENEGGQVNHTMAHAIERTFPFFAKKVGLNTETYLPDTFLSRNITAHQFGLLKSIIKKESLGRTMVIFDHNGGGGTNLYTTEMIRDALNKVDSILRIYFYDGNWIVHWLSTDDGLIFFTPSIDDLFQTLTQVTCQEIIINSVYGAPEIVQLSQNIIRLANDTKAKLDIKIHDFFALCTSPHLLDHNEKYCNVPADPLICANCLKNSRGWYHSWYPKENIPTSIQEWRIPFKKLFEKADQISFFDSSSVEILSRAFELEPSKLKVVPHEMRYFKNAKKIESRGPLHIGVLGTLSKVKGSEPLFRVRNYIDERNLKIPITLVGSSVVEVPPGISVTGPYEHEELPKFVSYYGINVILMPSIVPETFSYTLSEAMAMELPIVAFDIGAQGSRVRQYRFGEVIALDASPDVIMNALYSAFKKSQRS